MKSSRHPHPALKKMRHGLRTHTRPGSRVPPVVEGAEQPVPWVAQHHDSPTAPYGFQGGAACLDLQRMVTWNEAYNSSSRHLLPEGRLRAEQPIMGCLHVQGHLRLHVRESCKKS